MVDRWRSGWSGTLVRTEQARKTLHHCKQENSCRSQGIPLIQIGTFRTHLPLLLSPASLALIGRYRADVIGLVEDMFLTQPLHIFGPQIMQMAFFCLLTFCCHHQDCLACAFTKLRRGKVHHRLSNYQLLVSPFLPPSLRNCWTFLLKSNNFFSCKLLVAKSFMAKNCDCE